MAPRANAKIRALADGYTRAYLGHGVEGHDYVKVDTERAARIAGEYAALQHAPQDRATSRAYEALAAEILQQWYWATDHGYSFIPWRAEGQPYANSAEMRADVAENKRLYFFQGGDMPADHALAVVHNATGYAYNDMFRAIHDLFGHAQGGFDFGPRGEENAYLEHRKMFSATALAALTTETRGQNSWVNFGPFSHLPAAERPFADQKCGLLPAWCWEA